jgi:hypothetical protein
VLAMADFNNVPFHTSLVLHALGTRQQAKLASARYGIECGLWL